MMMMMMLFSRGPTRVMNLTNPLIVFLIALICCTTIFESAVAIDAVITIRPTKAKADNHHRTDEYKAEAATHYLDRTDTQATWVSVRDIATDEDRNTTTTDGAMCKLSFIDRYII